MKWLQIVQKMKWNKKIKVKKIIKTNLKITFCFMISIRIVNNLLKMKLQMNRNSKRFEYVIYRQS
jgi:hypothetical protein